MAFPQDPLTITVELTIDGAWTAITSDVLGLGGTDAITITRGRASEQGRVAPTVCELALYDPTGKYNPDNPSSTYYRKVGLGTPLRVKVGSDVRFVGEIAALEPEWDSTGNFIQVRVEAAGLMRRHGTGAEALRSATYRTITTESGLVAYWPGEAGSDATGITADTLGVTAVEIGGEFSFGADTSLVGSGPLGKLTSSTTLRGVVPPYTAPSTQQWTVAWMMRIPEAPANAVQLMVVDTPAGSTIAYWTLDLTPGGGTDTFALHGWSAAGVDQLSSSSTDFVGEPYGEQLWCSIRCTQNGSDIDWEFDVTSRTNQGAGKVGTETSSTLGPVTGWRLPGSIPSGDDDAANITFGHFAVFTDSTAVNTNTAINLSNGHEGELAADRMFRLCAEEGVTFTHDGDISVFDLTPQMGPQQIDTLLELLFQAAELDGGILYERRDGMALRYMARALIYNQVPALELNYTTSTHLSEVFRPVADDARLANDVTVSRVDGGQARWVIPDGDFFHLTTQAHPAGIGVHDDGGATINAYEDDQLNEIAQWRAHLGAWREQRFPQVSVQLARSVWAADSALTADARAVDVGDYITVDTTNGLGWLPPDKVHLLVQGYTERIGQYQQDFTWNTTPYLPWEVWQLDTSGSTMVHAVNSAATTWRLATSLGPEWDTDAVTAAYHAQASGEAVTVTDMVTATPAFIAAGTAAHAVNASVAPALPAGITPDVGQLLLVWAAIRNSGTGTVNLPSGWTNIVNFGNVRLFGRYYVTGDTAPTVTFTGGAANQDTSAQMCAFSGLSMELASGTYTTPAAATQLNGSAQDIAYPLCRVVRDGGVVLFLGWKQDDWTSVTSPGDAEIGEPDTTTGDDQGIVWSYDIYTTAAEVSAGSFTVTGGASAISRAVVLALRPLQTATVTRAVNGVSGSVAAAAEVHGWRMGVNAL